MDAEQKLFCLRAEHLHEELSNDGESEHLQCHLSADEDCVIQSKAPEQASKWTLSGNRSVNRVAVI